MEYEDIYEDLPEFDLGQEMEKLKSRVKQLEDHIQNLQITYAKQEIELTEMKKSHEILKINISELYITAKREIDRKNKIIADLREERDNIVFRKKQYGDINFNKRNRDFDDKPVSKKQRYNDRDSDEKSSNGDSKNPIHFDSRGRDRNNSNQYRSRDKDNYRDRDKDQQLDRETDDKRPFINKRSSSIIDYKSEKLQRLEHREKYSDKKEYKNLDDKVNLTRKESKRDEKVSSRTFDNSVDLRSKLDKNNVKDNGSYKIPNKTQNKPQKSITINISDEDEEENCKNDKILEHSKNSTETVNSDKNVKKSLDILNEKDCKMEINSMQNNEKHLNKNDKKNHENKSKEVKSEKENILQKISVDKVKKEESEESVCKKSVAISNKDKQCSVDFKEEKLVHNKKKSKEEKQSSVLSKKSLEKTTINKEKSKEKGKTVDSKKSTEKTNINKEKLKEDENSSKGIGKYETNHKKSTDETNREKSKEDNKSSRDSKKEDADHKKSIEKTNTNKEKQKEYKRSEVFEKEKFFEETKVNKDKSKELCGVSREGNEKSESDPDEKPKNKRQKNKNEERRRTRSRTRDSIEERKKIKESIEKPKTDESKHVVIPLTDIAVDLRDKIKKEDMINKKDKSRKSNEKPLSTFENILTKKNLDEEFPELHLTHDGEIPILHLEEDHFKNVPLDENMQDKNILNLIDAMNITGSALECDVKFKNASDDNINAETLNATKEHSNDGLSFTNCLNKVTSTPNVGEDKSCNETVESSNNSKSDSINSNKIATAKRKRRRVVMSFADD
ncbi:unnamed protein product [Brassicogethes aeneus]|uniref:Uncharacterized protein n=1 Tax=Brassicogethes aeneus TaxID=1431903 RepID=A0A9P0B6W1_BRAAE|nr:unnamed protein product [Brassicogethes aeneus]